VFLVDAVILAALALLVSRLMITAPVEKTSAPPNEEI
jgi:hypothetical protein